MRTVAIALAALVVSVSAAFAAPASVTVTVGPVLQAKAEKTLGVRDVEELAADLRKAVEGRLARTHAYEMFHWQQKNGKKVPDGPKA